MITRAYTNGLRNLGKKVNILEGLISPLIAPIAQWIEQFRPKEEIYVRIVVGAPGLVVSY